MSKKAQKPVDWSFDPKPAKQGRSRAPAPRADEVEEFSESVEFSELFELLTGNPPFPWQQALYERLSSDESTKRFPSTCDIPTGLGKTSVIAVWLLALAHSTGSKQVLSFPRRLVYVVNRRTVVDQSTREAEQLRHNLLNEPRLTDVVEALRGLASQSSDSPLAISTLRGQFVDNAEWRDDPARPAVIVGTVDMIGSRLLFSGYGRGFKTKPAHAAFLAQDALLVHDEAHLEPAFQSLLESIHAEQQRHEWERGRFHVMALSATARTQGDVFGLSTKDWANCTVKERLGASKAITFHDVSDDKKIASKLKELVLEDRFKNSGKAILVFVRQVKDVVDIKNALQKANQSVETLTGTLRGYERDRLVENPIFVRFMPKPGVAVAEGTVYLVCTSAGEVGVNISADHLVCDLTPLDSMAQRMGRVHRFGRPREHVARIEIVVSTTSVEDDLRERVMRTRESLERLPEREDGSGRNASPGALSDMMRNLSDEERHAAFSPQPTIRPVTDILFDAWAMTTIREPLPGRPRVDDYLHGVSKYDPPQTQVAWRFEVERLGEELLKVHDPEDLLDDFPLKPQELIQDRTDRVLTELLEIATRHRDAPVWIVGPDGKVRAPLTLSQAMAERDKNRQQAAFAGCTVLLPPFVGGLANGLLKGNAVANEDGRYDVADQWLDQHGNARRGRTDDDVPDGMRLIRAIDLSKSPEAQADSDQDDSSRIWSWYVQPKSADDDGSKSARAKELLADHLGKAGRHAQAIASKLVTAEEARTIALAAEWHDLGKNRRVWQRSIGNTRAEVLAKSGPGMRPREITRYRHEFGSLIDVIELPAFLALGPEQRELVLHMIAAHHGRARPHFPLDEAFDPEQPTSRVVEVARAVPRRFAALQSRYGRWGLAYLESLVRAADAQASQEIGTIDGTKEAAE